MTQKKFASRPEYKSSTDSIGRYFRPKIRIYVLQILLILSRVAYAVVMTQKKLVSRMRTNKALPQKKFVDFCCRT